MGANQMKKVDLNDTIQGFINSFLATKKKRILNPHSAQNPLMS